MRCIIDYAQSSISLGSFPVVPGCGGRGPQKKALCK